MSNLTINLSFLDEAEEKESSRAVRSTGGSLELPRSKP